MKRKNSLSINIGLNNNPIRVEQLWKKIKQLPLFDKGFSYSLELSTYKGEEERTYVINGTTPYKLSKIVEVIESLTIVCEQECMAFKYANNSVLLYNPTSTIKESNMLKFDKQFYINN